MKKAGIIHLGCSKNQVDTEILMGFLKELGYTFTPYLGEADLVLVNTCAFIKPAWQEAEENINFLKEYKENNKNLKIVVTGCYVERFEKELEDRYPFVDLFIGPGEYDKFVSLITSNGEGKIHSSPASSFMYTHKMPRVLISPNFWVYVKISEGCNNFCSYCTIPFIRGRLRSRSIEDIIKEVEILVQKGAKEINLIAQDTTRYGEDLYGKSSLVDLLKSIENIKGDFYVRILYSYPSRVTKDLINFIKVSEKVVPYFDIPIQHVNDEILKKMNRSYKKDDIIRVWSMIRENFEDAVIRTTVMVGFPGETEENFEELIAFIKAYPFDRLGAFTYYNEEGTISKNFDGQIDEDEKIRRYDILMSTQKEISKKLNAKLLGREFDVIIENEKGKYFIGRSWREAPEVDGVIMIPKEGSRSISIGDRVRVKIKKYRAYDLLGELV